MAVSCHLPPGCLPSNRAANAPQPFLLTAGARQAYFPVVLAPKPKLLTPRVCCLSLPSDQSYFQDQRLVGHPSNLEALRTAGAEIEVVRSSCLCLGKKLSNEGFVDEMLRCGRTLRFHSQVRLAPPEVIARSLTHLRCWIQALEDKLVAPLIILEANACIPDTRTPSESRRTWAEKVVRHALAADSSGVELLLLGAQQDAAFPIAPMLAAGYVVSPNGLRLLSQRRSRLHQVTVDATSLVLQLLQVQPQLRSAGVPLLCGLSSGIPKNISNIPRPTPMLIPGRLRGGSIKVILITLPHRADRRVMPLVGGPAALQSMRDAGCDVEVLRASCYCERDSLVKFGHLSAFLDNCGHRWAHFRRYEGAEEPMSDEEAEDLISNINRHYESGANRLIEPEEGDVKGYVVDSNWPGATACAISHIRALIKAAIEGYEFCLVFEDDATIPASVAKQRGWCDNDDCEIGKPCYCADSWGFCVSEAVELLRRSQPLDALYLGLGEAFEPPGPIDGLLEGGEGSDSDEEDLGGVTEIGYTWCAQAILYSRSALDDVLRLRLHELLWAQDETIPHLYGRFAWNKRFVRALHKAGWKRKWVVGAPSDNLHSGWVEQLEAFTDELNSDLGLGTAWLSSNSQEF